MGSGPERHKGIQPSDMVIVLQTCPSSAVRQCCRPGSIRHSTRTSAFIPRSLSAATICKPEPTRCSLNPFNHIMRRTLAAVVGLLLAISSTSHAALGPSPIKEWFAVLQQHVRDQSQQSQVANRFYGWLGLSIHNALEVNNGKVNETAVAAYAAHTFLTHWFQHKIYVHDLLIQKQLAGLPATVLNAAQAIGQSAANKVTLARVGDGYATWARFQPAPPGSVGQYQFTPNQTYAIYPKFGDTRPSVLDRTTIKKLVDKYLKPLKPYFKSPQYYKDLAFVKQVGSTNSTRTPYDNQSPSFWAGGANTSTVGGYLLDIAVQVLPPNLTLRQQAKFFAQFGTALADASVACYKLKYVALFWRPITAIRSGDGSNNYTPDPTWTPLLPTPQHPSYPSGHQCTSGAAVEVIKAYTKSDNVPVSFKSEALPTADARNFTSLSAILKDVGNSRVYGGVHFPFEADVGGALGSEAAKAVLARLK